MSKQSRVTVLGDGGWGTAIAVVNARKGNDVYLWSAFSDYATEVSQSRENKKFLPGIELASNIQVGSNLQEALNFSDVIVLAIPTQFVRSVLEQVKTFDLESKIFVTVSKGIEKKTCLRPSEIITSILGNNIQPVVLSGPSHAEEVARGIPTLVVVASDNVQFAERVQQTFIDKHFRIYVQHDVVGVEMGGALKNVIAIAAGVCEGLEFGDNTKSGLITRGLYEMSRLGVKLGANPTTFFGLSGIGDLVTTCFSPHGRNLRVGKELGQGKSISEILEGMEMVAEGVDSAEGVLEICKKENLELPILEEVHNILFKDKSPKEAVSDLLSRSASDEWKQGQSFQAIKD